MAVAVEANAGARGTGQCAASQENESSGMTDGWAGVALWLVLYSCELPVMVWQVMARKLLNW